MGYQAKITSKGQITLPAAMRRALNLNEGDRIAFSQDENGRFYIEARTNTLADLRGIATTQKIRASDIDRWIADARGRRG